MSITTKATTKVASVAIGLALATSMLSLAPMAHAAALTNAQVQSILSLLTSFGADAATIANVQASLTGGTPSVPSTPSTGGSSCSFSRDLTVGSTGADVTCLQNALKAAGYLSANATGYFGALTQAGVVKWQTAAGVTPAAGYFGAKSRAAFNVGGGSTPSNPGAPITGNGLKVMLASDSPNGTALVAEQAIGELAKFTFSNPTGSAIRVTNLALKRTGTSADSTLTNVYLYQGAMRLTDAAGISNSAFSFNDASGLFTVPAGGMVTVSVRSDILAGSSGQQVGVQLVSVASNGTLDSSASFPINGGLQTISSASMGTVVITYTGPSNATENPGTEVRVWEGSTVIGTHAARLESITFENRGTSDDNDITNLRLYVDGAQVGSSVAQLTDSKATFDLTASPLRMETGTRIIKVMADLVGGSGETYDIQLRRAADLRIVDVELNQPVLATDNDASFPVSAGTANNIAGATLSVVKATNSPSTNVSVGASNVKWSSFEFRAAGEDVKIEAITVDVDTTEGDGMNNVKVFVNGVQVGSTRDVGGENSETGTEFTFGSSFIAKQGAITVVDIYGDAKEAGDTNYASGATVEVGVSVATGDTEGMDSGDAVSSVSEVEGNQISMTAAGTTLSKASGYGNQTVIAGTNNVKLGSFTLSAGSTEGVNVNTITVTLSSDESASVTDLMLKDSSTGAQIGSTKASVSTSNSFSSNFTISASGTKTIDIYGNIKSSANAGSWIANVNGSGTGATTATSVSFGHATDSTGSLQTITVGSATLSVNVNAGSTPDSANAIAGSSMVKVGSFRFTSQYSAFTIDKLAVKIPNGGATSVSAVILKGNGLPTEGVSAAIALPSTVQSYATATFTGLTFAVPADQNKDLDVYVNIPTIASGATSGAAISAVLDFNNEFSAKDSSGTASTTMTTSTSGDIASNDVTGKGTTYVRKSIATLAAPAAASATLAAGTDQVLGKFTVAADAAGDIDWGQVVFTVTKTTSVTIGDTSTVKLYDVTSASTQVGGTFATSTATQGGESFVGSSTGGSLHFRPTTVQTVAAGSTRSYELRGTVAALASGSNNVSVSIAAVKTSASANAIFSTIAGTLGTAGNTSFAWSDWSDPTDHASSATGSSTTDWTNDYLVKTLPLTVGSRSVNI